MADGLERFWDARASLICSTALVLAAISLVV
jgi:hypothetical protein